MCPVLIFSLSASVFVFSPQWYYGCSKGCCDYTGSIRCCHLQYRSSWWRQYVCQGWLYRLLYFLPAIGPRVRTCCSRSVCIHWWSSWLLSGIVPKKIILILFASFLIEFSLFLFRAIPLNFWMISLNWSPQFSAPSLVYSTVFTTESCLVLRVREAWPPRCSSWLMRLRRPTSRPPLSTGCGIASSSAPYVLYMDWNNFKLCSLTSYITSRSANASVDASVSSWAVVPLCLPTSWTLWESVSLQMCMKDMVRLKTSAAVVW